MEDKGEDDGGAACVVARKEGVVEGGCGLWQVVVVESPVEVASTASE